MRQYYDAFDRWVYSETDDDADDDPADLLKRWFVYDGSQIAAQFEAVGTATPVATRAYFWGLGVDQLLADENLATGETLWALTDHLGSVRDLVDDAGTLRKHTAYDSFGNVQGEQFFDDQGQEVAAGDADAVDTLFGYTGRPFDDETQLQNNHHRWYDAPVGRWLSQDPIGFAGGDGNVYRYVGNGSTGAVDPDGLQPPAGAQSPAWNLIGGLGELHYIMEFGDDLTAIAAAKESYAERMDVELHRMFSSDPCPEIGAYVDPQQVYAEQIYRQMNKDPAWLRPIGLFFLPGHKNPSPWNVENFALMSGGFAPPRAILPRFDLKFRTERVPRSELRLINPTFVPKLGIATRAVVPEGVLRPTEGVWPAVMKDGKVYVERFHNLATKAANCGKLGPIDADGFVRLDSSGNVIEVNWGWVR